MLVHVNHRSPGALAVMKWGFIPNNQGGHRVRKRLRKKLHQGEFQEMGFEVQFRMSSDLNESAVDVFIDAFLEQAIEANRLMFGGGGRWAWKGFVTL